MPVLPLLTQHAGPMPVTATFQSPSDAPSFVEVSGSVWSQHANVLIGIEVLVDGKPAGKAQIWSNTTAVHRAVVPVHIPVTLQQGNHTITLQNLGPNTISDFNDYFEAVLLY